MDEFKSATVDFLKFQHKQQKKKKKKEWKRNNLSSKKKKGINPNWIYKKNDLKYKNKHKSDNKNSNKFYFKLNKSKETYLNWQTGGKLETTKMRSLKSLSGAQ